MCTDEKTSSPAPPKVSAWVIVQVEGRHNRLRRLHEEDFKAEVSLKNARPGRFVARIDTDNVSAPAGVRVIRVTPTEVRAILETR